MSGPERHPIPRPPHPTRRREKLPWQSPKEAQEDPDAPARQQQLMRSPSYRQSFEDVDYLVRDETRGIRLQLDYGKPELLLGQQGIHHTVVVFGSARLQEPRAARRHLESLEKALSASPGDATLKRRCRVARRVVENSRYYEVARAFGRLVGDSGSGPGDCRMVVITGGGPGIMEAANRGAYDTGAKTIGLNITLPHEQFPNPYITPELCFRFHYFALRKMHFLLRAKALVAFPGGFGTLDELFETLTLVQTRKIPPLPVVLVGEAYWRKAIDFGHLAAEGVIDEEDLELFWFAETALEAWEGILRWHESNGTPLFG
ncbi:MAG TPA: TIGR00730 family Rossman fold protein [Sedimenticola sp.]|nr:TIGR00730 family Rossman fold protein [Sedimenticola sp.]